MGKEVKTDIHVMTIDQEFELFDPKTGNVCDTETDGYQIRFKEDTGKRLELKVNVPGEDVLMECLSIRKKDGSIDTYKAGRAIYNACFATVDVDNALLLESDEYTSDRVKFYDHLASTYLFSFRSSFKKK